MFEEDSDIITITEDEEVEDYEPEVETSEVDEVEEHQEQSFQPAFFETEPKENVEEKPSPTLQKETTNFVKSSYSTNNLRRVYKKYDVVQTYVPAKKAKPKENKSFEKFVKEQANYIPERETIVVEKVKEKPTYKLNQKAKSWLFAITSIFVMLGGLAIYNAIHISNLNKQVAKTEYDITEINKSIEKATKTVGKLTNQEDILDIAEDDYNMHVANDSEQITIDIYEKNDVVDYKGESNFFDKVCDFVRNFFGG